MSTSRPSVELSLLRSLLVASLALLVVSFVGESRASACKLALKKAPRVHASAFASPVILEADFQAAEQRQREPQLEVSHLWFELGGAIPEGVSQVVLESVWGSGPDSLESMWGRPLDIRNGHVFVYPEWRGPHRDQPFSLGVRLRYVYRDGSVGTPSLPVFIHHAGKAKSRDGLRSDHVILFVVCIALLGMWNLSRRQEEPEMRIRLAAATALVSLLFVSVTPALSWLRVEDPSKNLDAVECRIGDEVQCATYVPDAGPNPVSSSFASAERRMELTHWVASSAALRFGLILSLLLLMPALIWLLVAPRVRAAQASVMLGALASGYTFLAACLYRFTVPSWMEVSINWAADITMIASLNIIVAAGTILFWSFRIEEGCHLPRATLERPRRR